MENRGYVLFYDSFYQAGMSMSPKNRLAYYDALLDYALNGNQPSDLSGAPFTAFIMSKPNIDASYKRREFAHSKKEKRVKSVPVHDSDMLNPCKDNVNDNVNPNDNANANDDDKLLSPTVGTVGTVGTVDVAVNELQWVFDEYARLCPSLQSAKLLTDKRADAIRLLLSRFDKARVTELFGLAESNSFLKGGGDKGWVASFDWLISPENAARVLEGAYDKFKQPESGSFSTDEFVQAALAKSFQAYDL